MNEELISNNTQDSLKKRTECVVYSRVVGWLTPIKNWNPGKQSEWADRQAYKQ
jgi:ribonucleoside-triphosphate reductase